MTDYRRQYRDRIAALSTAKKALLRRRVAAAGGGAGSSTGGRLIACILTRDGSEPDGEALRAHCQQRLPDYMVPQRFVALDELPRTPAGKVDRLALQAIGFDNKPHDDVGPIAPRNEIEARLAAIWADVLGFDDIGMEDDFFEVGGDSLLSIRILSRAGKDGLRISPEAFFSHPTIAGQAKIASVAPTTRIESGLISGPLPLLPIQHWFFERVRVDPHHWNQSLLFSLGQPLTRDSFERSVQKLLLHHDALRTRFVHGDTGWAANIAEAHSELPVHWHDVSSQDALQREAFIEETATILNADFDLSLAPLVRFAWFDNGDRGALLIVMHHLIVDAESWRVILADLKTLIEQSERAEPLRLPAKTSSIRTWATRLCELANEDQSGAQADYWRRRARIPVTPVPADGDMPSHDDADKASEVVTVALDEDTTQMLMQELPRQLHCRMSDALVSALARVVADWSGSACVRFDMEGHGREALFDDVDISRTAGWFTTVFPVTLVGDDLQLWKDPVAALRATKEQLRDLPYNGLGHGLQRYLASGDDAAPSQSEPLAQILFNYLGQVDQDDGILTLENARCGQPRSPRMGQVYLIEINAHIAQGRLETEWRYRPSRHGRETIERLAGEHLAALRELFSGAESASGAHTPSDFPLAGLDQDELDGLSGLLDELDDE